MLAALPVHEISCRTVMMENASPMSGRKLKLTLEYEGTFFHGWQRQTGVRTVQGVLQDSFQSLTGEAVEFNGASRTDRGVHALGQVASFSSRGSIPLERLAQALNGRLPRDVRVRRVEEVPETFHARHSAVGKHYRYLLDLRVPPSVFLGSRALSFDGAVDVDRMRDAAGLLVGTLDFAAFACARDGPRERDVQVSKVRTIYRVSFVEGSGLLAIDVWGKSFLYKMVRTLAGSLLEVGRGRWSKARLQAALESKDRRLGGPALPGSGLCLHRVFYEPEALQEAVQQEWLELPGAGIGGV